jgi:hypothetical protein
MLGMSITRAYPRGCSLAIDKACTGQVAGERNNSLVSGRSCFDSRGEYCGSHAVPGSGECGYQGQASLRNDGS